MARDPIFVKLAAADVPFLGDSFGTYSLVHQTAVVSRVHARSEWLSRPKLRRRSDRNTGHCFHAARYYHRVGTRHDTLRREMNGLLARTTLAVEGSARDRFRKGG